jgi:hypothetical protein
VGERVLDSVDMVSTVSGGSIGAMYWVDAYTRDGAPSDAATIDRLRAAAEAPTLEAMAWGIVYLVWNRRFGDPDHAPTLAAGRRACEKAGARS